MSGHLLIEPGFQGMACPVCCSVDKLCLEWVDHSDVQGGGFATRPVGDEDVSWSGIGARDKGSFFSQGTEGSTRTGVEEVVPEVVELAANIEKHMEVSEEMEIEDECVSEIL